MSAALCLIVWNEAIERPNCMRILHVVERVLAQPLGAAHHLVGEADRAPAAWSWRRARPPRPRSPSSLRLDALEREPRQLARLVHGLERLPLEARGVAVDGEEGEPVLALRPGRRASTTIRSAVWPSSTKLLVPSSLPVAAGRRRRHRDARGVAAAAVLGEGQGRGHRRPSAMPGSSAFFCSSVPAFRIAVVASTAVEK